MKGPAKMVLQSLYQILGVSETANPREIKSAFRKKALKLHPDVNKAPDAQERFMEAKMAFQTLSDESARRDYDRKLRMGFGSSRDWSSFGSTASGTGTRGAGARPRQAQPEDNYTFEDFMRDLDKEVSSWAKERSKAASPQDKPGSLFEELAMVGEEFVEFLEDSLGLKEDGSKASPSGKAGGSSSSSSRASNGSGSSGGKPFGLDGNAVDAFDLLMEALGLDKEDGQKQGSDNSNGGSQTHRGMGQTRSSSDSWRSSAQQQQPPPKQSEDDLDAQLAELKRKVGREK
ncbi:hypothetical protein DUNSADRAFT_6061 [Dunaliella salina]|uniref:J domain-containing protein n=1 Tax=Dunaliella salina TaxID=3046 RepID=A0ABQ7GNZ7_DUNSA|nr:hypothetical protein DUNSADRAFT_6061 [Dunaliella salina]|eukprot:KAF5836334.1 hypothetical protein DUNSADRAFT_6061 [Dunaliella salina]